MGKKKWMLGIVLSVVLVFGAGVAVGAAGTEPGSNSDPLITKSYLDSRMANVTAECSYQEVTLSKGKKLVCPKGTQIVLISGSAQTTASLSDITVGQRVAKNKAVSANHSCLVTKDSTGVKASKSCTLFVAGEYKIQ